MSSSVVSYIVSVTINVFLLIMVSIIYVVSILVMVSNFIVYGRAWKIVSCPYVFNGFTKNDIIKGIILKINRFKVNLNADIC